MRPSYHFLGFCQAYRSYGVSQELLGDDCPNLLDAFYAAERKWVDARD